ncbi:MAG: glycoside hydrolase family 32 protein [Eubacteriales bacterium]|nr:glycoside hydrolase family 32 protein [Eubacteriales bacterium]
MNLKITSLYLWIPIDQTAEETKLEFYHNGKKVQELDAYLGKADCGFYTAWNAEKFLGEELEIRSDTPEKQLKYLFCWDEKPQNVYPFRPKLHFTPYLGWQNDPNGLIYANGLYHLYYQWNPYGVHWGNMHWGHAVSTDLIHWHPESVALEPDETGSAYSGCALQDFSNTAGFGKDALLFFYTAAGGRNKWSQEAGNRFTQRLAYSTDGGRTLQKSDRILLDFLVTENRDPKVFYHPESQAYILILYLEGFEFALYRSNDLFHWEETQRLTVDGMWECPNLERLPVEGTSEEKWVFWSADGYYQVGTFDGWHFQAETERKSAYFTKLRYAAQSFAGTPGRVVTMGWMRLKNTRGHYCGAMSLPTELSLVKNGDYQIRLWPAREVLALAGEPHPLATSAATLSPDGAPVMLDLEWSADASGIAAIRMGKVFAMADLDRNVLHLNEYKYAYDGSGGLNLKIIIDQEIVELFGNDGTIYGAYELGENVLGNEIQTDLAGPCRKATWCRLAVE